MLDCVLLADPSRDRAMRFHPSPEQRSTIHRIFLSCYLVVTGCATTPSLDMSDGPIEPPGQDIGIVIGSVFVQTDREPPDFCFVKNDGATTEKFDYAFE